MSSIKLKTSERAGYSVLYILLGLLTLIFLYPFYYFLILSFNDAVDTMKGGVYLWPRVFTIFNYEKAFSNPLIISSYGVTLFRTIFGTAISLILTAMAGYALIYKKMPGRGAITFLLFFTTIFNGGIIPFYILLRDLHLLNNIWVYILPTLYVFFNIILMRTYFQGLPMSLMEAASIDGCNDVSIFFKVYLPLSAPVLATIGLFIAVGHWNDWFIGSFFVNRKELWPSATLLQQLLMESGFDNSTMGEMSNVNSSMTSAKQQSTTPESLRMTFLIITTVPIMLVYPFIQKFFVKGVVVGSIKG